MSIDRCVLLVIKKVEWPSARKIKKHRDDLRVIRYFTPMDIEDLAQLRCSLPLG